MLVAIDIGGTFTDLMAFDAASGRFSQAKSLTTPAQLVQGIIDCLDKSGLDPRGAAELIHGSTTAINTLIERKGAKTGLIVTRGTRDVYAIGRGNRPESYNLLFRRHRTLVPRRLTHVRRRIGICQTVAQFPERVVLGPPAADRRARRQRRERIVGRGCAWRRAWRRIWRRTWGCAWRTHGTRRVRRRSERRTWRRGWRRGR